MPRRNVTIAALDGSQVKPIHKINYQIMGGKQWYKCHIGKFKKMLASKQSGDCVHEPQTWESEHL